MSVVLPPGPIAVTGAAGYVGQRLAARLLAAGRPVVALVRADQIAPPGTTAVAFDEHLGSDALADALRQHGVVAAVHLAARYARHHQPADLAPLVGSNILLGTVLLDALARAGCPRLVLADSAFAHQGPHGDRALGLYGATRQALARIVDRYVLEAGLEVTTLVVHDVYGPLDTRRRLVPVLLDALAHDREVTLVGEPVTVDLVYVDDVVEAFLQATLHGPSGTWAVRSPALLTPLEVADVLERVTGRTLRRRVVDPGPGPHPGTWAGPILPGWTPSTTLEAGLTRLTALGTHEA